MSNAVTVGKTDGMIDPHKIWQSPQLLPVVALGELIELCAIIQHRYRRNRRHDPVRPGDCGPAAEGRQLFVIRPVFEGQVDRSGRRVAGDHRRHCSGAGFFAGRYVIVPRTSGRSVYLVLAASAFRRRPPRCWRNGTGQQARKTCFFWQGLLLGLGRLAMLKTISKEYEPVIAAASEQQCPLVEMEQQLLGISHVEVGVELMRRWGMPDDLITMVQWHHESLESLAANAQIVQDLNLKTMMFSAAVGDYFCGYAKGLALDRLRKLAARYFHLTEGELDAFLCEIRGNIEETADLFSIDAQSVPAPSDLLAQANEQLALLTVSAQAATVHANARQEAAEHEVRKLEVKHEQLKQQAIRDPLTGLYNRQFFDDSSREFHRCTRHAQPLGIIFFDADSFKLFNDNYGHAFRRQSSPDALPRLPAETVRGGDVLARYGGEEFVVLVSQPSEKSLEKLAERIRSGIEQTQLWQHTNLVRVTVSVGAAIAVPERHPESAGADIVAVADQAMYEAKQAGRNQIRLRNMMSDFDRQVFPLVLQRRFSRWLVSKGHVDPTNAARALLHCQTERRRLGEIAENIGLLTPSQTEVIRTGQARRSRPAIRSRMQLGLLVSRNWQA